MMKILPSKQMNSDFTVENDFKRFMQNCTKLLKSNHTGVLEAMILDSYEQQEEKE